MKAKGKTRALIGGKEREMTNISFNFAGWCSVNFDAQKPKLVGPCGSYRRIFHDVTLPRQRKNWGIMAPQGAIAGDHFCQKRERNIDLQLE